MALPETQGPPLSVLGPCPCTSQGPEEEPSLLPHGEGPGPRPGSAQGDASNPENSGCLLQRGLNWSPPAACAPQPLPSGPRDTSLAPVGWAPVGRSLFSHLCQACHSHFVPVTWEAQRRGDGSRGGPLSCCRRPRGRLGWALSSLELGSLRGLWLTLAGRTWRTRGSERDC